MIRYYFAETTDGSWAIVEANGGKTVKLFKHAATAARYCRIQNEKYRAEEAAKVEKVQEGDYIEFRDASKVGVLLGGAKILRKDDGGHFIVKIDGKEVEVAPQQIRRVWE